MFHHNVSKSENHNAGLVKHKLEAVSIFISFHERKTLHFYSALLKWDKLNSGVSKMTKLGRPPRPKRTLKPKVLERAHKTMGSWEEVARSLGISNRMLSYYRDECEAPVPIVEQIEDMAPNSD